MAEPRRTFGGRPRRRRITATDLAIAFLLVLSATLGTVVWQRRTGDQVPVLVMAASVGRGEAIETGDLRVAYVTEADGIARLDPSASDAIAGRAAVVDLRAGTVLTSDLVRGPVELEGGTGIAGLALAAGQYPSADLAPGDRVKVVVSPIDGSATGHPTLLAERAEVYAVERVGGGRLLVSVKAAEPDAAAIASVADPNRIRLVRVPR
ncbi:MAG: hypothetical protein JWM47_3213 [Acidimicrobiales bacterium]|nr:hypothetical protein [Acidimicrobiales bacterium]